MESVGVTNFSGIYAGRRVLVTGHTGFKGSWLAYWLKKLGAQVTGISLPAETSPNHWNLLGIKINEHLQDILDANALASIVQKAAPEIVFHLAAQPLVRRSYAEPLLTWSTNVMGTAHVLEACRSVPSVKAIVVVTTDKCYENLEQDIAYDETSRLGGHDPYSASKAATEILCASYRKSFFNPANILLATARAGNVIGGGDWSQDRLIPDLVRSVAAQESLLIRSPNATRPWQHVLDPLSGYLMLGMRLLQGNKDFAEAWNFGPDDQSNQSVETMLKKMQQHWPQLKWNTVSAPQPHEARLLHLDSSKAKKLLHWFPLWNFAQSIEKTADWYQQYMQQNRVITSQQLQDYTAAAEKAKMSWVQAA